MHNNAARDQGGTSRALNLDHNDAVLRPLRHFAGARDAPGPADRLREVRRRAAAFREEMLAGPRVRYYRSCSLVRAPYPTRYGLRDACLVPTPLCHILNRLFVIQFDSPAGVKTLLASPTDYHASARTPFYAQLEAQMGVLAPLGKRLIAPELGTVEGWLQKIGITPEQVDYISYDHLHTQDLRKWLGSAGQPAYFPNAKLLVMKQEWESALSLLPPQAQWYCPEGLRGVAAERLILLADDVGLGDGVALLRTPGHTEGNHSFVVHTPLGLLVTSENGIGPDAYAPLSSRIPGVRRYARRTGSEVIVNGNTLESSVDQYISMIQERDIAGRSPLHPEFYNVVTSSELSAYWAFPGIRPTFSFGDLCFGQPHTNR